MTHQPKRTVHYKKRYNRTHCKGNDRDIVTGELYTVLTSSIVLEFKWRDNFAPSTKSISNSDSITSATNSLRENLS